MNQNFVRFNRGGILLDIENQKHHHHIVRNPRRTIQIQNGVLHRVSYSQCVREKQLDKLRKTENQRLYKALRTIIFRSGPLEEMFQKAEQNIKERRSLQHISQFRKDQKKIQLRIGNTRLVSKICEIKPIIGSNKQWQKHFTNNQKQKCKISRARHHCFDASIHLNQYNNNNNNLTIIDATNFQKPNNRYTIDNAKQKSKKQYPKKSKSSASQYQPGSKLPGSIVHQEQFQKRRQISHRKSDGERLKATLRHYEKNKNKNTSEKPM